MVHVFGAKEYDNGVLRRDERNCGDKHAGVCRVTFHRRVEKSESGQWRCLGCGLLERDVPKGSAVVKRMEKTP